MMMMMMMTMMMMMMMMMMMRRRRRRRRSGGGVHCFAKRYLSENSSSCQRVRLFAQVIKNMAAKIWLQDVQRCVCLVRTWPYSYSLIKKKVIIISKYGYYKLSGPQALKILR